MLIAVAIITFFIVGSLGVIALTSDSVAALGQLAAVRAIIGRHLIAVITFLVDF
jgi:hypothetical protein